MYLALGSNNAKSGWDRGFSLPGLDLALDFSLDLTQDVHWILIKDILNSDASSIVVK